jgi:hypothetical protein
LRFYAFLGVGIVADIFMASIEVITAQEITVSNDFGDGGEKKTSKSRKSEVGYIFFCWFMSLDLSSN